MRAHTRGRSRKCMGTAHSPRYVSALGLCEFWVLDSTFKKHWPEREGGDVHASAHTCAHTSYATRERQKHTE